MAATGYFRFSGVKLRSDVCVVVIQSNRLSSLRQPRPRTQVNHPGYSATSLHSYSLATRNNHTTMAENTGDSAPSAVSENSLNHPKRIIVRFHLYHFNGCTCPYYNNLIRAYMASSGRPADEPDRNIYISHTRGLPSVGKYISPATQVQELVSLGSFQL